MFFSDVASRNVTSAPTAPAGTRPRSDRSDRRRADDRPGPPTPRRSRRPSRRPCAERNVTLADARLLELPPRRAENSYRAPAAVGAPPAPCSAHSLRETRGPARAAGEQLPAPASARKPPRPVADDGRQPGHDLPAGDRDAVPAVEPTRRPSQHPGCAAGSPARCRSRQATCGTSQRAESRQRYASGDHDRGGGQRVDRATTRGAQNITAAEPGDVTIPRRRSARGWAGLPTLAVRVA